MPEPAPDRLDAEELAAHLRFLADSEFAGYCPIYERIADRAAEDLEFCALVADLAPRPKIVPVLLFACVHDAVLRDPTTPLARIYAGDDDADPWPTFRAYVVEHHDSLSAVAARRAIQTNEVGRAALVLPVLSQLHATVDRPLTLVEIGSSAGLNLFLDRYFVDYGSATCGDPSSPVQLRCDLVGDGSPPIPSAPPPIAHRLGIDLAPVDVTDPAACRWLEACLWPQVPDRAERLRAAVGLARRDPPELRAGNAVDLLGPALEEAPTGTVPVVVATWVLAYLSPAERHQVHDIVATTGASRDVALVTMEYPGIAPGLPAAARQAAVDDVHGRSLVGVNRWAAGTETPSAAAWVHAHGRWLDWLDADL